MQLPNLKHVDLVIIDDDELLIDTFTQFLFKNMAVDTYFDPQNFLDNVAQYPSRG